MLRKELLNTQKDSLFRILDHNGFNPKDFRWEQNTVPPQLTYNYGPYFCKFFVSDNPFELKVTYSPGKNLIIESYPGSLGPWESYEVAFRNWLSYLKSELNADSLWDKLNIGTSQHVINQDFPDDDFTPSERDLITQKFESIKKEIGSLEIGKEDIKRIESKLDHLLELTRKLGKRDWFSILIGSFAGLLLELTITQETVTSIWAILKAHFIVWHILP